jgi:pimeloyl-ACP methyl ester carboxylesterase
VETPAIHVTRWGSAGPRVILVHGGVQGSEVGGERNFAAQRPLAEQGWQLVVPDRPGHGRSPDPGRPDDAEADGLWVAELLEDGAHLVGHSFGGCVALSAAEERPAAVRSLTLVEPGMHNLAIRDRRVKRFVFGMLRAMLLSTSAVRRAKRAVRLLGIPPEATPSDPAVLKRLGRNLARGRLPSRATLERQLGATRRAGVPLLVVTGGWSPAFEVTGDFVAAAGGGRRAVVESPHHFPQWRGDAFNPLLAAFLEENEKRRR